MKLPTRLLKKIPLASTAVTASLFATAARATGGGSSLPWDGPLTTLQNNLTGPVATAISAIAFAGAGLTMIFAQDELNGFVKKLLLIVLAVTVAILGNRFLGALGIVGSLVA